MTTQAYLYNEADALKLPEGRKVDLYTKAYAVGYFYGRAMMDIKMGMPEEDQALQDHAGFKAGIQAGFEDFQNVDLPIAALGGHNAIIRNEFGFPINGYDGVNP